MNRYLIQQGYCSQAPDELGQLRYKSRLTSSFGMMAVILGLSLNQPLFLIALFTIGAIGFGSRKLHPLDFAHNVIAPLIGKKLLTAVNPWPRRYSSFMSASFGLIISLLMIYDFRYLALAFGGLYVIIQLCILLTHFCIASWTYEQFYKFLGYGSRINLREARELRMKGALLIDVRTPKEHEKQVITGAINIPLLDIADDDSYHGKDVILFCNSGLRAREAMKMINNSGAANAYSLGCIKNAIKL